MRFFLAFSVLLFSSISFAQVSVPPGYDGPAVDYNFIHTKPAKYAECDQYLAYPGRVYAACEFGRDEAERMAERFAGGKGRIQGFIRGYAWGLNKMASAYRNDASEMENGEKAVDGTTNYDGHMASGLQAGINKGKREGTSRGKSDAIKRFRDVLDTGRDPDDRLMIPEVSYTPEVQNPYRTYVGAVPDEQSLLREINPGQLPVYDSWDDIYLGEKKPLSVWDLWFEDGIYTFPDWGWFEGSRALEVWLNRPIDTKPKYNNLNNPPLVDANGVPVTGADGNPINLQQIFRRSFGNSYEYYVNYYFSREMWRSLGDGQTTGELVGIQLGKRLALYAGIEKAFNRKFNESAKSTFLNAFESTYSNAFNSTYDFYANNAVLSLSFTGIEGLDADGIIRTGEVFSAFFTVQNLGGVGVDLQVSVSGDVSDVNPPARPLRIEKSMTSQFEVTNIARIARNVRPYEKALITLRVNGESATLDQLIQNMVEMIRATPRLDVISGSGNIEVLLRNVSTQGTPSHVVVELLLDGIVAAQEEAGKIAAGDHATVAMPFRGLDPLKLILSRVDAKIIVRMDGSVMDDRGTLSLRSGDQEWDLVKYYDGLVNNTVQPPAGVVYQERVTELQNRLLRINEQEIADNRKKGRNIWKSGSSDSVVGKLVNQYQGHAQEADAEDQYDRLAELLWPARMSLPKVLFWGAKRKDYSRLVNRLSTQKLD